MREVTVQELQKLSKLFNLSTDEILNYDENIIPKEVVIEDKTTAEQIQLIQQLEEDDKQTIFKLIDKMLTNKKFKDFFNKKLLHYKIQSPASLAGLCTFDLLYARGLQVHAISFLTYKIKKLF